MDLVHFTAYYKDIVIRTPSQTAMHRHELHTMSFTAPFTASGKNRLQ